MKVALAIAFLASWAQLVLGAPLESVEKRDVFVPPVLYPHAGTVWYSGQRHNVTWYAPARRAALRVLQVGS